jgi:protein-S-isoprenylcysteine O-methyltransferase Ste14
VRHPFRRKHLRLRLLPAYALAALLWATAQPTCGGYALGAPLVAAGLSLRAWGAGHLVKTDLLTVSGPYAHLRHPLYAGTLLLALGFGAIAGAAGLLIVICGFLPFFFLYYLPYKERVEGERLEARYGAAFAAYRRAVPALVPTLSPWSPPPDFPAPARSRWSSSRYRDNDELGTLVGVAIGLCLFAARRSLPP